MNQLRHSTTSQQKDDPLNEPIKTGLPEPGPMEIVNEPIKAGLPESGPEETLNEPIKTSGLPEPGPQAG